jgi:hypothetical protein
MMGKQMHVAAERKRHQKRMAELQERLASLEDANLLAAFN